MRYGLCETVRYRLRETKGASQYKLRSQELNMDASAHYSDGCSVHLAADLFDIQKTMARWPNG